MNIVMIVPTGIGAEIGGHSGDATPAARLLASVADNLIIHPNVVNASDINEMTDNMLYVEGSMLDRFLTGDIKLKKVYSNKILVAANKPIHQDLIHSVSAARATLGIDARILELETPLVMKSFIDKRGFATGSVKGWEELVDQLPGEDNCDKDHYDALAISSFIEVPLEMAESYLSGQLKLNPWGGVEAKLSKLVSNAIGKPVAHAPFFNTIEDYKGIVDPRKAAEMVSCSYIHCVLKGLHRAPRISQEGLSVHEIDFLVSPDTCYGDPHIACSVWDIPIIVVRENKTCLNRKFRGDGIIFVDNYLEAVGVIQAAKIGATIESIRRPLKDTEVWSNN